MGEGKGESMGVGSGPFSPLCPACSNIAWKSVQSPESRSLSGAGHVSRLHLKRLVWETEAFGSFQITSLQVVALALSSKKKHEFHFTSLHFIGLDALPALPPEAER